MVAVGLLFLAFLAVVLVVFTMLVLERADATETVDARPSRADRSWLARQRRDVVTVVVGLFGLLFFLAVI